MAHQPNKQWRSWYNFFLFLPIGHFGCAPVRHCKLLFAIRSRSNLSICYKLPQILKLPQISRCSCIFARCDISLHCTSYLFVPPTTFARRQNCFLLAAKIEQKFDKIWSPSRYSVQWRAVDQVIKSFATHYNWKRPIDAKKCGFAGFHFVAKSVAIFAATACQ